METPSRLKAEPPPAGDDTCTFKGLIFVILNNFYWRKFELQYEILVRKDLPGFFVNWKKKTFKLGKTLFTSYISKHNKIFHNSSFSNIQLV